MGYQWATAAMLYLLNCQSASKLRKANCFPWHSFSLTCLSAAVTIGVTIPASADDSTNADLAAQIRLLQQQNSLLQQELQQQGDALDALTHKVKDLESSRSDSQSAGLEVPAQGGFNLGKVNLSVEGGVAFFETGSDGFSPDSEFRVDEARIFLEAPIWNELYFFTDLDLATRENTGLSSQLGELYLDYQDVSQLWGKDSQLNVRAGRLFIPFGEEYMTRYAAENPLISHSLADFWGIDPGVEAYGQLGKFSYVVAVQNGGGNGVEDFDGDKSVTARLGFDPDEHWHFSLSGMRTGDLNPATEPTTQLWFANGFFRSLGSPATSAFHANLVEGDVAFRWKRWHGGHVSGYGGYARYADNDPLANNGRDLFFYSVEAAQNLPHKFYTAVRFSELLAQGGYPLLGFGDSGEYFYGSLTKKLWRLSLGLGYRFNERFLIKTEYSLERGEETDGSLRDHEDFFGTEAAFKF
jgi:hypothetical protein